MSTDANDTGCMIALSELAAAYAKAQNVKVTLIAGNAIGTAYTVMGSYAIGADVVFALDNSCISTMLAESAVEFVYDKEIADSSNPDALRSELIKKWKEDISSPLSAAANGDVDDVISYGEMRQRVASAFEMLCLNAD